MEIREYFKAVFGGTAVDERFLQCVSPKNPSMESAEFGQSVQDL
jgi:hypothetical protein